MPFKMDESTRSRFEEMMDVFDIGYIANLFIEGEKIEAFPPNKQIQGIKIPHKDGYLYTLTRQRILFPAKVVERG